MVDSQAAPFAAVALAAGEGLRLRPLTELLPKPLCPVGDRTLLDHTLDSIGAVVGSPVDVAVNAHHLASLVVDHVAARDARIHVSVETEVALGTAGAIAALREWIDGRGVLVANADTFHREDLEALALGWDGESVRVMTPTPGPFGATSGVVASMLPHSEIDRLRSLPSGLWECVWARHVDAGTLETVHAGGTVIDCATPRDYLRANLEWSGGDSVVGAGAVVRGRIRRSVVWPGEVVEADEDLVDAIRFGGGRTLHCG